MSEQPVVRPGAKIAVQVGDELIEDTVHSVHYRDAQPEVVKHPTGWRKLLRALTPARWRKPLPVVRPYRPAQTEVIMTGEHGRRLARTLEDMNRVINDMMR